MSYACSEISSNEWSCVASADGPYKNSNCNYACGYDCLNKNCVPTLGGPYTKSGCNGKCSMYGCATKAPFGCYPWDEQTMSGVESPSSLPPYVERFLSDERQFGAGEPQAYVSPTCDNKCATQPAYVCENGTCVISTVPGKGTPLGECQSTCRKYECRVSSGGGNPICAKKSGPYNPNSDGFDTQASCTAVCETRWRCNKATGTCLRNVKYGDILFDSAFKTMEECIANGCEKQQGAQEDYQCISDACQLVTGYTNPDQPVFHSKQSCSASGCGRYSCDFKTSSCFLDKKGIYADSGCDGQCNKKYNFNSETKSCIEAADGTLTLADCQDLQQNKGYACDPVAGQCVQYKGQQTKADCEKKCNVKYYTCNAETHQCEEDTRVNISPEEKLTSTAYACHKKCKLPELPYYFDAPQAYAAGSIFNNLGFGFPVGNGTFNLQTLRFIEKKIDVDGKPKPEDAAFCAGFQIFKDFVYVYNPDFRYQNYIKSSFQNKTTRSATLTSNTQSLVNTITANANITLSYSAMVVSAEAQASVETKSEVQMHSSVQSSTINIVNQAGEMRLEMTQCIALENINPLFIEKVMQLPVTSSLLMSADERAIYEQFLFGYKKDAKPEDKNIQNPGSFFVTYIALGTRYKQTTSRLSSDMSTLNELKASACASVSAFGGSVGACASYGTQTGTDVSNKSFTKTTQVTGGSRESKNRILEATDPDESSSLNPIDMLEWMDGPMKFNEVIGYKYMSVWDLLVNLAQQIRATERQPTGYSYDRRAVPLPDDPALALEFATEECNLYYGTGNGQYDTSSCNYLSDQPRVYTFSQALLVRAKLLRDVFNEHADTVHNCWEDHSLGMPLRKVKFPKHYRGHLRVINRKMHTH